MRVIYANIPSKYILNINNDNMCRYLFNKKRGAAFVDDLMEYANYNDIVKANWHLYNTINNKSWKDGISWEVIEMNKLISADDELHNIENVKVQGGILDMTQLDNAKKILCENNYKLVHVDDVLLCLKN